MAGKAQQAHSAPSGSALAQRPRMLQTRSEVPTWMTATWLPDMSEMGTHRMLRVLNPVFLSMPGLNRSQL